MKQTRTLSPEKIISNSCVLYWPHHKKVWLSCFCLMYQWWHCSLPSFNLKRWHLKNVLNSGGEVDTAPMSGADTRYTLISPRSPLRRDNAYYCVLQALASLQHQDWSIRWWDFHCFTPLSTLKLRCVVCIKLKFESSTIQSSKPTVKFNLWFSKSSWYLHTSFLNFDLI